jgi:hypothetical protein
MWIPDSHYILCRRPSLPIEAPPGKVAELSIPMWIPWTTSAHQFQSTLAPGRNSAHPKRKGNRNFFEKVT